MTVVDPHVTASRHEVEKPRWAATAVALLSLHIAGCSQDFKNLENIPPVEASPRVATAAAPEDEAANTPARHKRKAKSAVIFIGDGMGVSTVTAGRIHAGQKRGVDGESHRLSWDEFPEVALVKTYNFDAQVPDSAGTATALLSGFRARIGQVNVPPVLADDETHDSDPRKRAATYCAQGEKTPTLAQRARESGRRFGVVSTARITHATPAASFGHAYDRGWEGPADVPAALRKAGCTSLAEQLAVAPVDLALGGGARAFADVDISAFHVAGDLEALQLPSLGLYASSHMAYEADREDQPSLVDMTVAAIGALENESGYVLVVESGRIDHAHHDTNAYRALEDLVAMDAAVAAARAMVGDDTLILVTADHGHVFTHQGYPARNNPVLGLVHGFDPETRERSAEPDLAPDGRPYTALSYANGPVSRADVDYALAGTVNFREPAGMMRGSETHSGEDVPLYATGAGAEAFGGVMDQPEVGQTLYRVLGLQVLGLRATGAEDTP